MSDPGPLHVVVMWVSGTGKSTVAAHLAEVLGWDLVEGDDLHPAVNLEKMRAGTPLTDADREPWLDLVAARAREQTAAGRATVLTCSALRRAYRDRLRRGAPALHFVHLASTHDVLEPRMARRDRHVMPASLLASQLATLEPLGPDEDGSVVDVGGTLVEVLAAAEAAVRARLARPDPARAG